jgi:hypothetical protein
MFPPDGRGSTRRGDVTITDDPQLYQGPWVIVSGLIATTRSGSKPGTEFHFVCGMVWLATVSGRNLNVG